MNTKTMRLPPRRVLTSNKRKEREGFDSLEPSSLPPPVPPIKLPKPKIQHKLGSGPPAHISEPVSVSVSSNQLLAGYLAHEYLTKGTLFGQRWDPTREEATTVTGLKTALSQKPKETEVEPNKKNYQRYVEVSSLLKAEGAHLPGVVNPSQLARFLHI